MWVLAEVEAELRRVGGAQLLDDARIEAEWYASLYFPWDQVGDEPLPRLAARVDVLSWRLDRVQDQSTG